MRRSSSGRAGIGPALAMLALFLLLAVVHTWPLASAPGTLSRNDNADTVLHEWTIAWVAHQVVRDPLHLFDGNIFYPERDTLAYSDHLFPQAMMAAPVLWAGGSPVLAYNLLLIAGLALTGWTASLLIHRWTGSWLAGTLSGSLMAFNALTLTRLPQIQDLHLEFFPLALLALDRLLAEPRVKHGIRLAVWFVLQALSCGYLLVFVFLSLVAAMAARPQDWMGQRLRRVAPPLLVAAGLATLLLIPFMLPYLVVSREQGLTRSLAEVAKLSAQWSDYLSTGGRLHYYLWSRQFFRFDALFPGIVGLGLAGFAVWAGVAVGDGRARMALAFGIVAFAFSFGTRFPLYPVLYYAFPLMSGIRGAVRFGQLFLAAIAILAGFGLVTLKGRMRRGAVAACVVLVLAANIEALRAPVLYRPFPGIPSVYNNLKNSGQAVVACFPFYAHSAVFQNAGFMLASTRFWKPILNGYSGFAPASHSVHAAALDGFPNHQAIQYLRGLGVTHVVVDGTRMSAARLELLPKFPELELFASDGKVWIYTVRQD